MKSEDGRLIQSIALASGRMQRIRAELRYNSTPQMKRVMKTRKTSKGFLAGILLSVVLFHGCEILDFSIDIVDIYGSWIMEDISVDIDVNGDNFAQVVAFRSLAGIAKGALNKELDKQLDSIGASMTFNEDMTFDIVLFLYHV